MSERIAFELLLGVLEGDRELLARLCESGAIPSDEAALRREHADAARVAYTLVHELDVNWAGVEVILRMRSELTSTRRQVAELIALLRRTRP
jgi:hypothetical protein